jgi:hypothetical protein
MQPPMTRRALTDVCRRAQRTGAAWLAGAAAVFGLATALGTAHAEPLTSAEPAKPFVTDGSLAGTWARVQFNQHLFAFKGGRASTYLHVVYTANPRWAWGLKQAPCPLAAMDSFCLGFVPDWSDVRVPNRRGGASVDTAEPALLQNLAVETTAYWHFTSMGPVMGAWRAYTLPQFLVGGLRVGLDTARLERRTLLGTVAGKAITGRAGPHIGYQLGWMAGSIAWLPVGLPLAGSNDGVPIDRAALVEATAWAPTAGLLFLDMDFPTVRKTPLDWISPELRFKRSPVAAEVVGGPPGTIAWVHELTFQVLAVLY